VLTVTAAAAHCVLTLPARDVCLRLGIEPPRALATVERSVEWGLGDFGADKQAAVMRLIACPELQCPITRQGRSVEELDVSVKLCDVSVDDITMVGAEARVRNWGVSRC
jgi:hypothetical protein